MLLVCGVVIAEIIAVLLGIMKYVGMHAWIHILSATAGVCLMDLVEPFPVGESGAFPEKKGHRSVFSVSLVCPN
jgi:hypothetical protein